LLREAVRQQDAAIPISHVQALGELIDAAVAPQRLTAWLMSALALAAVLIAVFGVAAVTACIVAERRREIAVRIALGSSPRRVCAHLVLDLKRATVVGGAIGVAGAIGLVVGFRGIFYAGAKEFALSTAVALLLISIGTVTGAAVPAWRAARIDAVEALRED
jgi:putative ABC transport system permease protein